jgi:hypothetical protein
LSSSLYQTYTVYREKSVAKSCKNAGQPLSERSEADGSAWQMRYITMLSAASIVLLSVENLCVFRQNDDQAGAFARRVIRVARRPSRDARLTFPKALLRLLTAQAMF